MIRPRNLNLRLSLAITLVLYLSPALAKPHEHGVAEFEISLSGKLLGLRLSAPLDSLLGFERAPRSEQEKNMYRQLRKDLLQYGLLVTLPTQAACTLESTEVSDPHDIDLTRPSAKAGSEHQDMVVEWQLRCESPGALKRISFQGFDRYKRLRRVDAVFNTPSGLGKARLTSRQRDLQLP